MSSYNCPAVNGLEVLNNHAYLGEAVHKGVSYPGEHKAIISQDLWEAVHGILKESLRARGAKNHVGSDALLKGIIFAANGTAMTPTFTRKGERLYHYPVSIPPSKRAQSASCPHLRRTSRHP